METSLFSYGRVNAASIYTSRVQSFTGREVKASFTARSSPRVGSSLGSQQAQQAAWVPHEQLQISRPACSAFARGSWVKGRREEQHFEMDKTDPKELAWPFMVGQLHLRSACGLEATCQVRRF